MANGNAWTSGSDPEPKKKGTSPAVAKANKRAEKAENRLVAAARRRSKDKAVMVGAAHHAGQAATTTATAGALSYAEGRFGADKLKVAGWDLRKVGGTTLILGGLAGEVLSGHEGFGYVTAAGLGSLVSGVCSDAMAAGQKARAKAGGAPAAQLPNGGGAPQDTVLLNELQATPEPAARAAGVGGRGGRRPKRRIEPNPDRPEVPPHLANLLRRERQAAAA